MTLITAYREIAQMTDKLSLPKVLVDRANTLLKQVNDIKVLKLRTGNIDAIVPACIMIVCRQNGLPRTFKEICVVSKVSKEKIGRAFKLILKSLETSVGALTTGDFTSRFCSSLSLSSTIQTTATYIARMAVKMDLVPGQNPISVAAAAIYMASQASDDKKTAKEIGEIAGLVRATIEKTYKSILPQARVLFSADFKFSVPVENLSTKCLL